MKHKILLLTASYGTGHITAAKSVQKILNELYSDKVDTELIDLLKTNEAPRVENPWYPLFQDSKERNPARPDIYRGRVQGEFDSQKTLIQRLYNKSMEKPVIWDKIFDLSDNRLSYYYFSIIFSIAYKHLYELLAAKNPDAVIITHPYWHYIVNKYCRDTNKKIKCICIVTDSTKIHYTWYHEIVDYYIVADNESKEKMVSRFHAMPDRIFPLGFPVNSNLGKEFVDKHKFMAEIGVNPQLPVFLVVVGLGDVSRFIDILNYLDNLDAQLLKKFQTVVICGKYKELYETLSKKQFNGTVKIFGWTDKMHDFIRISSLVISKGGGAIVMETLAAAAPVLIPVFAPGQEQGNTMFITKHNIGFAERDFNKLKSIFLDLINNPDKLIQMSNKIKQLNKPNASVETAKFIFNHL